ncbi:SGNH/GDSL hydrolase family protein [Streptomyces sp. NPDC001262]|uniref:SGNH/GDSL hydrolase family protein n=1 Tax=Streptomyces sp. NPDC001262 TaxID=3364552 RepID=UPI0036CEA76F
MTTQDPTPRRVPRAALLGAVIALLLTGTATTAAAEPDTLHGSGYVALGDSYSSGLGAGSYDFGSGECKRSARAYPALWAKAHSPKSFSFTACSGATTEDVRNGQLGPLSRQTGLVTLTAGANDAGFAKVMQNCAVSPDDDSCIERVNESRAFIADVLPDKLGKLYDEIGRRAPAAHVVVLGYPRLYKLNGSCRIGLSERKRTAIDRAEDELNAATVQAAARHRFAFVDANPTFRGHEICSADPHPWLHSLTFPVEESYHPTADGQSRGYLPLLPSGG